MDWLFFLLGIPAAIGAAWAYDILKGMAKARSLKLAIDGTWAEFVKDSKGHQYTLGRIYFDKHRRLWAFDGTNFTNAGAPYCHFETVASYLAADGRQFSYIFTARIENELDKTYFGFGVVNLATNELGLLAPIDGHYVSANVDGKGMSHSMIPVDMAYSRRVDGRRVVDLIAATRKRPLEATSKAFELA